MLSTVLLSLKGFLAVFIIILVIWGLIALLNRLAKGKDKDK